MTLRVEEYIREDGSNPYGSWFDALDPQAAAKVATAVLRLRMIVLFGGGTKHRQQTDIDRAKAMHEEYKARKAAQSAGTKKR